MNGYKDITGQRFGKLIAIRKVDKPSSDLTSTGAWWECQCDCGKFHVTSSASLRRGNTTSCGCNIPELFKPKDLLGRKFGRLLVLELAPYRIKSCLVWRCRCDCGKEKFVVSKQLLSGTTKSCGCLYKDLHNAILELGHANLSSLYSNYKIRAKNSGFKFELSVENFKKLTSQNCYYCGIEPKQILDGPGRNGIYIYNGIDRVDSSRGYELDNVVTCCKECNFMKKAKTKKDFLLKIKNIYENLGLDSYV